MKWSHRLILSACLAMASQGYASFTELGPGQFIQAGGSDIIVPGYSAPAYGDWNNDGLPDLMIGEGGNWQIPRVRVYPNQGTAYEPQFSDYFYIRHSDGSELGYVGSELPSYPMGLFPRLVYWDGDVRKDLLIGQYDGTILIYRNVGTQENPLFDEGSFLQVGEGQTKINIDVGANATPIMADWNGDGWNDLLVGNEEGLIHLFLNQGVGVEPNFIEDLLIQQYGSDFKAYPWGSSPVVSDLNHDNLSDLLVGDSAGRLSVYFNEGTKEASNLNGPFFVQSEGQRIRVDAITGASPRARPFLCDWNQDDYPDVLVGSGDGKVRLYPGIPQQNDTTEPFAHLDLGPEELVLSDGNAIVVPGHAVPSLVDWNNDDLLDLVVGESSSENEAKVRVYLNVGSELHPRFSDYLYVQSGDNDLTCPTEEGLGCFPRVYYWDQDDRKDLVVGLADGTVKVFLNINTDEEPVFDQGSTEVVGFPPLPLDVGQQAAPALMDWNRDGLLDLVVGALDGYIHIYENCGCEGSSIPPHFYFSSPEGNLAMQGELPLRVPSERSSPVVIDVDGDDLYDILTGNTEGQLLCYRNIGTESQPIFSDYTEVNTDGFPINIPGAPHSSPFACTWTGSGDGYPDVLVGADDGKIRLYRGIPQPGDIDLNGDVDVNDLSLLQQLLPQGTL